MPSRVPQNPVALKAFSGRRLGCTIAVGRSSLPTPMDRLGRVHVSAIRSRLTFANVVSVLALFIALGGSSYAAVTLRKNSVTSAQIKNGQVKNADLANNAVT